MTLVPPRRIYGSATCTFSQPRKARSFDLSPSIQVFQVRYLAEEAATFVGRRPLRISYSSLDVTVDIFLQLWRHGKGSSGSY